MVARGLCSKHYQRLRRQEGQSPGNVGRPRKYPEEVVDKWGGAPRLSVRLDPEVMEWAKEQGGGAWLRHATSELMTLSDEPEFKIWWERLSLPEG